MISYLPEGPPVTFRVPNPPSILLIDEVDLTSPSTEGLAMPTGIEPVTSSVTGLRSNRLSYGTIGEMAKYVKSISCPQCMLGGLLIYALLEIAHTLKGFHLHLLAGQPTLRLSDAMRHLRVTGPTASRSVIRQAFSLGVVAPNTMGLNAKQPRASFSTWMRFQWRSLLGSNQRPTV